MKQISSQLPRRETEALSGDERQEEEASTTGRFCGPEELSQPARRTGGRSGHVQATKEGLRQREGLPAGAVQPGRGPRGERRVHRTSYVAGTVSVRLYL